jgi:arylsulfatase A-like enzyme
MNVLLISVDALRADHLGYMQNYLPNPLPGSVPPTPNIDELAKDSIRCTSMFATGGSTKMSFPSIMTGMYPHNTSLSNLQRTKRTRNKHYGSNFLSGRI